MPNVRLYAITPQHLPKAAEYVAVMQRAAQKSANAAKRDLQTTTRTWQHKPPFDVVVAQTEREYTVAAGTDDAIYGYVDGGTRPHIIRPRRSRYLRFRVGGRPKTRVGVIGSFPGAPGTDWRSAYFVLHPGTGARRFTTTIARRRQKSLEQDIRQGIAKVARKAR